MNAGIKYALRNLKRNKLNTIITVAGLSFALASVLIIYLFVSQEQNYNNFHTNADRIFRLNYSLKLKDGNEVAGHLTSPTLAKELKDKIPQIEYATPYRIGYMAQFDLNDQNMKINLGISEQSFFNMFGFKLLHGNRETLLQHTTNIVLTRSLAKKVWPNKADNLNDILGEPVRFTFIPDQAFTVSGILEDIPKNSSISFEAMIHFEYERPFWQSNNMFGNSNIYYQLKQDQDQVAINNLIGKEVKQFYSSEIESAQKNNQLSSMNNCFQPFSLPLTEAYLYSQINDSYGKNVDKTHLNILTLVGALILIIAFSNYIILTIGQFYKKAGEVSIRKSVGGGNLDILRMFISENTLIIAFAFIIGAVLGYLFIPSFNDFAQSNLYLNQVNTKMLILFIVLAVLLLITLTSLVPFIAFRNIKPTALATKNMLKGKKGGVSHLFLGLQYTLTIILITAALVIDKQTNFLKNKSLGFADDNIISLNVSYLPQSTAVVLRDNLLKQPGVTSTALTNRDFFDGYSTRNFKVSGNESMEVYMFKIDDNFISTLELELIGGRNFFESEITPNNKSVIVNEQFIKQMGFENLPIGGIVVAGSNRYKIIGVVKDYQFLTNREKIEPMMLYADPNTGNGYSSILVKYNPTMLSNVISGIKTKWDEIGTKEQLKYTFWDQELENRYLAEERFGKLIKYATIIAIVILALGLFGLTVLISSQRINEIGIRKVNGAKISEVILLLNTNYIKWVSLAFILASPIAYFVMNKWLENFAFKTALSWWIFAFAGFLALLLALFTVSWQTFKAARSNPVEALRYE